MILIVIFLAIDNILNFLKFYFVSSIGVADYIPFLIIFYNNSRYFLFVSTILLELYGFLVILALWKKVKIENILKHASTGNIVNEYIPF